MANWNWKVVRRFVQERCEVSLSRSSCLNYLHRLGFVLKRPQKRLLKADAAKRETFVAEYAALVAEAQQVGAKLDFTHFKRHKRGELQLDGTERPGVPEYLDQLLGFVQSSGIG